MQLEYHMFWSKHLSEKLSPACTIFYLFCNINLFFQSSHTHGGSTSSSHSSSQSSGGGLTLTTTSTSGPATASAGPSSGSGAPSINFSQLVPQPPQALSGILTSPTANISAGHTIISTAAGTGTTISGTSSGSGIAGQHQSKSNSKQRKIRIIRQHGTYVLFFFQVRLQMQRSERQRTRRLANGSWTTEPFADGHSPNLTPYDGMWPSCTKASDHLCVSCAISRTGVRTIWTGTWRATLKVRRARMRMGVRCWTTPPRARSSRWNRTRMLRWGRKSFCPTLWRSSVTAGYSFPENKVKKCKTKLKTNKLRRPLIFYYECLLRM